MSSTARSHVQLKLVLVALLACLSITPTSSLTVFGPNFARPNSSLRLLGSSLQSFENATSYKILASVPGVSSSGISLNITEDGTLKLSATTTAGDELFRKQLRLAEDANILTVKAWCTDGVLEIILDKLQTPEPVRVETQPVEPPELDSDDSTYVVRRGVPGINADEIVVNLETDIKHAVKYLTVNATSTKGYGQFVYTFDLPEDADVGKIATYCASGLLHIHVPKKAPAQPVTVPVVDVHPSLGDSDHEDMVQWLKLELPGFTSSDVKLEATPGQHIHMTVEKDGNRQERYFALPDNLFKVQALEATITNGILKIQFSESALREIEEIEVEVSPERPNAYTSVDGRATYRRLNPFPLRTSFWENRLRADKAFREIVSLL